ncbi:oxidoreductase [Salinisphaera aquimarina]|uniref:Oxidoreductase n=1 Tax=Salinisphaera aquimarina TaxID=2094031 RepID=A0ABV7ELB0_9GAMM
MTQPNDPVWFITGCSTGFGRALAQQIIDDGGRAVMSARDKSRVADLAEAAPDRALAVTLDVTDAAQIQAAVAAANEKFGRIDVLVNNAGYGYQSSVEEAEDSEIRAQFEANVFGLFAITQAILPGMRERRRGHVLNISSVAGFIGFPGSGFYAASKHAVEGWSDALDAEVAPLGIRSICIEPGPFRTDWAGRSLKQTSSRIADYADTAAARMQGTRDGSGAQPGDPERAARAMIDLVAHPNPPHHLVLGAWGVDKVEGYLKSVLDEIDAWRDVSVATDYPD